MTLASSETLPHMPNPPTILTGDRPTGQLHLGHFAGSLRNRVQLQHTHRQFILLADTQALTDNADQVQKVRDNVLQVALDYLAVGIDPNKTTICVQSCLPALYELTSFYLNFVSVARLERNPTIKSEILMRGFDAGSERGIPAGFLCYPVSQAADITAFKATVVPVGDDQLPMIEQTNEIVRRINRQVGSELLPECRALLSHVTRLPGFDGKSKMSKSLGNTIVLDASDAAIKKAVNAMYTDPNHLRIEDPGQVEGNVVFTYLDAFDPNTDEVAELKAHYRRGGLGDGTVKKRLQTVLQQLIAPIREQRQYWENRPDDVMDILKAGTAQAQAVTQETLDQVKDGLGVFRF